MSGVNTIRVHRFPASAHFPKVLDRRMPYFPEHEEPIANAGGATGFSSSLMVWNDLEEVKWEVGSIPFIRSQFVPISSTAALTERITSLEAEVQVLRGLIQGRGIEKTPDVCGGAACIVRTRIPVWILEALKRQGATDAQILADYPTINATDLAVAWAYAEANRAEIDERITENDAV